MAASTASVLVSDFDVGPCRVTYNGIDLGGTLSNVTVNFKYEKTPLMADQYGKTILDEAISGIECTVETEIAQVKNKNTLEKVFPSATSAGGTITFNEQTALRMFDLASLLTLHPLQYDDAITDYDWSFFKAMPSEESSYTMSPTEQGKMKIVWKVYLDTSVSPGRMFKIGA